MTSSYTANASELTMDFIRSIRAMFRNKRIEININEVPDETEYLLSSAANKNHLLRSLAQAEKRDNLITISEDDLSGYRVTSASRASPQRGLFSDDKIMVKACRGHYED